MTIQELIKELYKVARVSTGTGDLNTGIAQGIKTAIIFIQAHRTALESPGVLRFVLSATHTKGEKKLYALSSKKGVQSPWMTEKECIEWTNDLDTGLIAEFIDRRDTDE